MSCQFRSSTSTNAMDNIFYSSGYKYQLEEPYEVQTTCRPYVTGGNKFVSIDKEGLLSISAGYAWDGASGPAIDTKNFMRGSLVHDALYQLIAVGILSPSQREKADLMLKAVVLEDGMNPVRAWSVYLAVKHFGLVYSRQTKYIQTAP